MKKRRREDPLESSVNDVVRRICAWEDACGGRFTVDTETLVGDDFIELRVRGVDEVRLLDVVEVVENVPHIVDYGCYFATQCLWFKFETGDDSNKRRIAGEEDPARGTEETIEEEYQKLRPRLKTETDEDTRDVCRLVVAMKSVVPVLHAKGVRVDLTPTPGVIVVNFKGLPRLDMPMIRQLRDLGGGKEANVRGVDAVVFLSPKEVQCVRVRNLDASEATRTKHDASSGKMLDANDIMRGEWKKEEQVNFLVLNDKGEIPVTRVAPSAIAGLGLFASKRFEQGEYIGFYAGVVCDKAHQGDYVLEYQRRMGDGNDANDVPVLVDAEGMEKKRDSKGDVHMANDAGFVPWSAYDSTRNNSIFTTYGFLRASRDIEKDEEIFVSYGEYYWSKDFSVARCIETLFIGVDVQTRFYCANENLVESDLERSSNQTYWMNRNQKKSGIEV